jgi:hypothetical protein
VTSRRSRAAAWRSRAPVTRVPVTRGRVAGGGTLRRRTAGSDAGGTAGHTAASVDE